MWGSSSNLKFLSWYSLFPDLAPVPAPLCSIYPAQPWCRMESQRAERCNGYYNPQQKSIKYLRAYWHTSECTGPRPNVQTIYSPKHLPFALQPLLTPV